MVVFNTLKLAPFALLQERLNSILLDFIRTTDYPYKKWKLRCISNDKARLDIVGKRETFKFEICSGFITLLD